jgi:hypothetical protein
MSWPAKEERGRAEIWVVDGNWFLTMPYSSLYDDGMQNPSNYELTIAQGSHN